MPNDETPIPTCRSSLNPSPSSRSLQRRILYQEQASDETLLGCCRASDSSSSAVRPLGAQAPKDLVAQGAAAAQEARDRDLAKIVPVKVKIVLSKYQGEKKISSLPYEMAVRTDGTTSNIRMGTQVPVPGMGSPASPGAPDAEC